MKVFVSPGANADSVTLTFTNAGSAETAIVSVAANGALSSDQLIEAPPH